MGSYIHTLLTQMAWTQPLESSSCSQPPEDPTAGVGAL